MGLFKICVNDSIYYLHHQSYKDEVKIQLFDFKKTYFWLKVCENNISVKKWSQNLQQSPKEYIENFITALNEQCEFYNEADCNISDKKNIFDLENNNLIWKQFFISKNIYGRKGKFLLDRLESREDAVDAMMKAIIIESNKKEMGLKNLKEENQTLTDEKRQLYNIAEESVKLKENFEEEIFDKFCVILNSKKRINCQQMDILDDNNVAGPSMSTPPNEIMNLGDETQTLSDASAYDDDTDVDEPTQGQEKNKTCDLKIEVPSIQRQEDNSAQQSQDLLDCSLEAELNVGFPAR